MSAAAHSKKVRELTQKGVSLLVDYLNTIDSDRERSDTLLCVVLSGIHRIVKDDPKMAREISRLVLKSSTVSDPLLKIFDMVFEDDMKNTSILDVLEMIRKSTVVESVIH